MCQKLDTQSGMELNWNKTVVQQNRIKTVQQYWNIIIIFLTLGTLFPTQPKN